MESGQSCAFDRGTRWPLIARATKSLSANLNAVRGSRTSYRLAILSMCLGIGTSCTAVEPSASATEPPEQGSAWNPCAASDHISKADAESKAKGWIWVDGFVVSEVVSSELIDKARAAEMGLADRSEYACYWYVQFKGKGDPNVGAPLSVPTDAPPTRTPRAVEYYATAEVLMDAVSGFVVRTTMHSGQIFTPDPDWSPQHVNPSFPTPTPG
jgi:hypothetical protein